MNFGTNLRNLRIQRNLTQQKLALEMSVSQASIAAYENGTREPSFETVKRFADFFRVAPSSLMPFSDAPGEKPIRIADSVQVNQKLSKMFEKLQFFSDEDLDTVAAVVNALAKKNEDEDAR